MLCDAYNYVCYCRSMYAIYYELIPRKGELCNRVFGVYNKHNCKHMMCSDTVPTEPPTTCSDLAVPANGVISYNMETTSLRPVKTVATYTCVTGYTLIGGSTRTCGSSGVWSGSPPVCHRKWNGLCTVCLLSVSSPIQLTALTYPH